MKIFIAIVVVPIVAIVLPIALGIDYKPQNEEARGRAYIMKADKALGLRRNKMALAEWAYATNLTEENNQKMINLSLQLAKVDKEVWKQTITYNWTTYKDADLKRMFKSYSNLGIAALSEDKIEKFQKAVSTMENNFATAKVCDYQNSSKCDLDIGDVIDLFASSRDPKELKHLWVQWNQEAGAKVKNEFIEYVKLSNEIAKANNFTDNAAYWLNDYEQDGFEQEMLTIWQQMKPFYEQIHAYVRKRLFDKYGSSVLSKTGPIPAHLLGNVWSQDWSNIDDLTRPYPNKPDIDITDSLVKQGYTVIKMFQTADEFFQSLNFTKMPDLFWKNSVLVRPTDGTEMVCAASAWDMSDGKDFRIKQCTQINAQHFQTVHHEMGHIVYYMEYKDLPHVYRSGANPGFHEAVGDVIAISVTSPKHLRRIGLLPEGPDDAESEINKLFQMGLEKIVFLPFALMLDTYRYGIFRGNTTSDNYNCHFWKLREELQGIEPPTTRTEQQFDAAAKYHISANVEYLRYYVSFIIQFQFHRALCEKAGEYVPNDATKKLVNCDIYKSTAAGNALSKVLRLGSSRPWQEGMEMLTGQRNMDAKGILEYFGPLYEWLKAENKKTGEKIGWEPSKVQYCTAAQKAAYKSPIPKNPAPKSPTTQAPIPKRPTTPAPIRPAY